MSVPAAVSLDATNAELADAAAYAASAGLFLDASTLSEQNLRFNVTFRTRTGVEFYCADYPLYPHLSSLPTRLARSAEYNLSTRTSSMP